MFDIPCTDGAYYRPGERVRVVTIRLLFPEPGPNDPEDARLMNFLSATFCAAGVARDPNNEDRPYILNSRVLVGDIIQVPGEEAP